MEADPVGRANILGVGISPINLDQTLATIQRWIARRDPHFVCVTPAHSIMDCYNNPELRPVFNQRGLTTPNGMSVVWTLRLMGHKHVGRVYGPDLMGALCQRSLESSFRHHLYCSVTGIAKELKRKLEVFYNGLDPNEFMIKQVEIQAWRERLGVSEEMRLVGVASRISPWKGQDIFLQACALLKEKVQNVHYLLVGDTFEGNEYLVNELHAFVDVNDLKKHVTFTGFVDDPRSLIAALDILVLPSTRPDPFPGVILEGMALGVPAVATNIGGPMEQVEDGRTGFLIPPSDPDAMASAILNLLNDANLRQSMGKAGRDRIAKEFTLNASRRRVEELYRGLLR